MTTKQLFQTLVPHQIWQGPKKILQTCNTQKYESLQDTVEHLSGIKSRNVSAIKKLQIIIPHDSYWCCSNTRTPKRHIQHNSSNKKGFQVTSEGNSIILKKYAIGIRFCQKIANIDCNRFIFTTNIYKDPRDATLLGCNMCNMVVKKQVQTTNSMSTSSKQSLVIQEKIVQIVAIDTQTKSYMG